MYRLEQLWRFTSLTVYSQQAGDLGELMASSSLSPKVWEPERLEGLTPQKSLCVSLSEPESGWKNCLTLKAESREFPLNLSTAIPFVLLNWLDEAYLHYALLTVCFIHPVSLNVKLMQKHPQSNTQTNIWADIWLPSGTIKSMHKINPHNHILRFQEGPVILVGHYLTYHISQYLKSLSKVLEGML